MPGIAAHQPVHDVDVVCAFLEEESGGVFLFGVPVAEIGVSAVVDEVTAPAALDLADGSRVDDPLHRQNGGEVAHVVADKQFGARFVGGPQNPVASLDGDRHRLFQKDRFSGFERGNGLFFMKIVRRSDHNRVDLPDFQQFRIVVEQIGVREFLMELRAGSRMRIGSRNDFPTLFRLVHLPSVLSASGNSDQTDFHSFHCSSLLFFQGM